MRGELGSALWTCGSGISSTIPTQPRAPIPPFPTVASKGSFWRRRSPFATSITSTQRRSCRAVASIAGEPRTSIASSCSPRARRRSIRSALRSPVSPGSPSMRRTGTEDDASLDATRTYRGQNADSMRRGFEQSTADQAAKFYLNLCASAYPAIRERSPIERLDDREANVLTVRGRYAIPKFWAWVEAEKMHRVHIKAPAVATFFAPIAIAGRVRRSHSLIPSTLSTTRRFSCGQGTCAPPGGQPPPSWGIRADREFFSLPETRTQENVDQVKANAGGARVWDGCWERRREPADRTVEPARQALPAPLKGADGLRRHSGLSPRYTGRRRPDIRQSIYLSVITAELSHGGSLGVARKRGMHACIQTGVLYIRRGSDRFMHRRRTIDGSGV